MAKTAEYTRKAIDKYRNQYDFINLRFPKGTKERLEEMGITNNDLVDECLRFIDDVYEAMKEDAQPDETAEDTSRPQEPPKTDARTEADRLAELQAMIDAKRADQEEQKRRKEEEKAREKQERVQELENYVREMKENVERERKERQDGYSQIPEEAFIQALRDDAEIRQDLALTREDEATRNNRILEFGEDNYNRFMKCLDIVEKEEKEQKRAETIAAVKAAE